MDPDVRPAAAEAEAILAGSYNLPATQLTALDSGSVNASWMVEGGPARYVLKHVWGPPPSGCLDFQEKAIDHLVARNFPIQPLLPTADGQKTVRHDDGYWQLRPFAEGRPYELGRETDLDSALDAMRLLHQTPAADGENLPSPNPDLDDWLRMPEATLRATTNELSRLTDRARATHLSTLYDEIRGEALARLSWATYATLPRRLIHGDLHGTNLFFNGDRLTCIVDWDAMGVRARVLDIAKAAFFLTRRMRGEFRLIPSATMRFLNRYGLPALRPEEFGAMIPILQLSFLPTLRYLRLMRTRAPSRLAWYLEWSAAGAASVRPELGPVLDSLAGESGLAARRSRSERM